jgi:K319-like protein
LDYKFSITLLSLLVIFSVTMPSLMVHAQTAPSTGVDRSIDTCVNQYDSGQLTADCYYIQQMAYLGLHYDRFMLTKGNVIPADTLIVTEQTNISLSGLRSTDPDQDKLSYAWTQTAGDMVKLSSTTDPIISFTAPAVNAGQVKLLRLGLSVNDEHGAIDQTSINIIVIHLNRPPIVTVNTPLTVNEGTQVTLSGSATDPDNDQLSYAWGQSSGPHVKLASYYDTTTTFTAPIIYPDTNKVLLFMLTADDGQGGKSSATVTVNVVSTRHAPTVVCQDMTVSEKSQVTLSSTVTNPDNNVLSYAWKQISGQPVVLSSTTDANPTFTAPSYNAAGNELKFQVDVDDGISDVQSCQMTVTVNPLPIQISPPVANAGPDQTVTEGIQVTLDGSASTGKHLTYSWKQTGGDPVALLFDSTAHPVFFAPNVDVGQTKVFEFTLTVSNENGQSTDSVKITVVNPNLGPTAVITPQ